MSDSPQNPFSGVISFPRPYQKTGAPSCGIYLVAPRKRRGKLFTEQLRRAITALNKSTYEKHMHALEIAFPKAVYEKERQEAAMLVGMCKGNGIVPIIRGDVGLCVEVNADGVILESAEEVAQARHILGERAIIGVDCGNRREDAEAALAAGADYVLFSRFFSASDAKRAELPLLEWWSSKTELPAAALGNLDPNRCIALVRSGAGFIAAGSYVWNHKQGPTQAIYWLQECIEHGLKTVQIN